MQYYTLELHKPSQELCIIVTPFGKYKFKQLPMGLKSTPDFDQQVMEEVLCNIKDTGVHINNIGVFSFNWERHISLLDKISHWLEANRLTVNPLECKQAIQETDWIGYWLTPTGLKPWHKKLMVLQMQKPIKPITNVWLPLWCQPLPLSVALVRTYPCTSLQWIWKENALLNTQNGSCLQAYKSTYGTRLPPCLS